MAPRVLAGLLVAALAAGCTSLLPKSKEAKSSVWASFAEAEQAFQAIVPGKTTLVDLREMNLDPGANPNIAILTYSDVMQRFFVNRTVSSADLDDGVRECLLARTLCRAFEINQTAIQKARSGNAFLDLLRFHRETRTTGWRFNGLLLVKEGVVVYKLTGGQPAILVVEETHDPLGPLHTLMKAVTGLVAAVDERRDSSAAPPSPYPYNPPLGVAPAR